MPAASVTVRYPFVDAQYAVPSAVGTTGPDPVRPRSRDALPPWLSVPSQDHTVAPVGDAVDPVEATSATTAASSTARLRSMRLSYSSARKESTARSRQSRFPLNHAGSALPGGGGGI